MNWSRIGESPALAANVRAKRIPQNKIVAPRLLFATSMKMFFPFDTMPNIIADSQRKWFLEGCREQQLQGCDDRGVRHD